MRGTEERFPTDTGMTSAYEWEGRDVIGKDGALIGVITALYAHAGSEMPTWAVVRTGLFGMKETLVPIAGARPSGEEIRLEVTRDDVNGAPRVAPDGELTIDEELELYRHYGLDYPEADAAEPAVGRRSTDEAMSRSEEELHVGTARRERGRARLRKHVVTEEVRRTVPVQREEARIEREPITDDNIGAAMAGPEISTGEHEVELHEEVPVVEKRTVPKERVRLDKETRTDEQPVVEHVRKERIEADDDLDR